MDVDALLRAVLATRGSDGHWASELLTTCHNGSNPAEIQRVLAEHPGEPECIGKGRILGALAPFRSECAPFRPDLYLYTLTSRHPAIGDQPFKQPPAFTRRILYNLEPTYADIAPWETVLRLNATPPYISNEAEVVHRRLVRGGGVAPEGEGPGRWNGSQFVVLCTDGLADLYEGIRLSPTAATRRFVDVVSSALGHPSASASASSSARPNLAKRILQDALGGDDVDAVCRMVTVQSDEAWMDDVTIAVQLL